MSSSTFRLSRLLQSMPSFVLSLLLLTLGILGIALAWSSFLRTEAITVILEHRWWLFFAGVLFTLAAILLFSYLIRNGKQRYVYITTGKNSCRLEESLVEQYLEAYWESLFPSQHIPYDVTIKKNQIRILAHFPPLPEKEQTEFLEKQKKELGHLFGQVLGYPHDVILGARFAQS